jgi:threonine dehydrogenase-like Zn-dependent dehydrogenase
MKALVKRHSKPGLWLEDVPEPEIGINDVMIRVDRTGICGTDLHIYKWDEWAQKTIPVPMVVGHEFVGRGRRRRLERSGFPVAGYCQRGGACRLRDAAETASQAGVIFAQIPKASA